MGKSSWWDDVDDLFGMLDVDTEKASEKKKKKKKKKKDSGMKLSGPGNFKEVKKSLKGLSRSELLKRIDSLGIALDGVDVKNKKSMRNAIAERMCGMSQGSSYVDKQTGADKVSVGLSAAEHEAKVKAMKNRPPYYIDEDSQDFIIPNCLQADDMTCFNGMMSLGAYRRDKRPTDGFGELMYRISKKLRELPDSDPQDVIDVTDFQVHEVQEEEPEKIGPQPPRYKAGPEIQALPEGKRPVAGRDVISGPKSEKKRR